MSPGGYGESGFTSILGVKMVQICDFLGNMQKRPKSAVTQGVFPGREMIKIE